MCAARVVEPVLASDYGLTPNAEYVRLQEQARGAGVQSYIVLLSRVRRFRGEFRLQLSMSVLGFDWAGKRSLPAQQHVGTLTLATLATQSCRDGGVGRASGDAFR